MKAAAEAPVTKVIDGDDEGEGAKSKSKAKSVVKSHGAKKITQKSAIGDSDDAKPATKKVKGAPKASGARRRSQEGRSPQGCRGQGHEESRRRRMIA